MIRFLLGCAIGAAGGAYFLAVLLSSSRENPTTSGGVNVRVVWPEVASPAT